MLHRLLARAALTASLIAAAFAVAPLAAAQDAAYTPAEREALREEIRTFLLEEPDLILEVLRTLEDRQRLAEEQAAQDTLAAQSEQIFNDGFSYVGGNPDGDIVLVEFLDYRCGFCKRAHTHVADFLAQDGSVKLILKEFPVLGPDSEYAGRAAMASLRQQDGLRYKPFHDAMMEHRGQLNQGVIKRLAAEAGLDVAQLEADMRDETITENIQSTYQLAQALGINGTPAFVMGDRIIRGFIPAEQMIELAAEVRAARSN